MLVNVPNRRNIHLRTVARGKETEGGEGVMQRRIVHECREGIEGIGGAIGEWWEWLHSRPSIKNHGLQFCAPPLLTRIRWCHAGGRQDQARDDWNDQDGPNSSQGMAVTSDEVAAPAQAESHPQTRPSKLARARTSCGTSTPGMEGRGRAVSAASNASMSLVMDFSTSG